MKPNFKLATFIFRRENLIYFLLVLAFLSILGTAWMTRYQIYVASQQDGIYGYKLDRWTGNVTMLKYEFEKEFKIKKY